MCYVTISARSDNMFVQSRVKSVGLVAKNKYGNKVNVKIQKDGTVDSEDAKTRNANNLIKYRCTKRIGSLLGPSASEMEFKRELLMCQYQELHMHMKQQQLDYEKALRINENVTETDNAYKKEYGTEVVNPHNFAYIHTPRPCKPSDSLLITVHSATKNFNKREALRNTWANPRIFKDFFMDSGNIKLVFVLGKPSDPSNQTMIDYEHERYNDIIQADFHDHYYNNTYKAIYNMKWIGSYGGCQKVRLVIKTDDDIVFNLRKFPMFWREFRNTVFNETAPDSIILAGNMYKGGPLRDPDAKWYIPYDVYKYDTFPPWFQGMVYFFTPNLAQHIYDLSFTTPYLFTDDVYVGIVADRVDYIRRWNFAPYYDFAYDPLAKKFIKWRFEPIVFYHNPSLFEMYSLFFLSCSHKSCR